jgi:hypothetical protein
MGVSPCLPGRQAPEAERTGPVRACPIVIVLASAAAACAGPDWTEIPDAPKLPPGQLIPFAPVESVAGTLEGMDAAGGPDIADIFRITITEPNTTIKTGAGPIRGLTNFDSVIFVFDENGIGVVANDDVAPGDTTSSVTIAAPGVYLVAFAVKGVEPVSMNGPMFEIYAPGNQFAQVGPTAAGMLPIQNWIGVPIDPEPRFYLATIDRGAQDIPVMSPVGLVVMAGMLAVGAGIVFRRGWLPA